MEKNRTVKREYLDYVEQEGRIAGITGCMYAAVFVFITTGLIAILAEL